MNEDNNKYFALANDDDLLQVLTAKVEYFYEYIEAQGLLSLWRKLYDTYYGRDADGFSTAAMGSSGTQGELTIFKVNDYRNLLTHIFSITTQNRPALKTSAVNTDQRSYVQTILGDGIIDYYMNDMHVEDFMEDAVEMAIFLGEGWVSDLWDAAEGDPIGVDENDQPIFPGEPVYSTHAPMDIVRDPFAKNPRKLDWHIIRDWENKHTIAAKFPKMKDEILDCRFATDSESDKGFFGRYDEKGTDVIPTYTFIHKRTNAVPEGRMVKFLNSDVKLLDTGLPQRKYPLHACMPSHLKGTPFGYTIASDLLGIQDMTDALYSTIASNNLTFGVQNVMAEDGSNVEMTDLGGGMKLITHAPGKAPQPLNLTQTAPETYNFLDIVSKKGETISGVNSIVRGDAPANVRSGNAMALLAAQTVQFNSALQKSYTKMQETIGDSLITQLQDFAGEKRLATISGKFNRSYVKEFKGSDLDKINRVKCEVVNPVSKTSAGRLEIANNMLQNGMIQSPQQYQMVLDTGRLEPMTEGSTHEFLLIKGENEYLADGKKVAAVVSDNHQLHLMEHKCVLSDPAARMDPSILEGWTAHMQDHIRLLQTTDPNLLTMMGQQPLQQAAPQGQGGPPAPKEGVDPGTMQGPAAMQAGEAENVSMPTNPQTGQAFNPEAGM